MKKFAKFIRVLTVSPIMAFLLCTLLLFSGLEAFSSRFMYFICLICLSIIPVLAYPMEKRFKVVGKRNSSLNERAAERKLAIILSFVSYFVLLLVVFATNQPIILKRVCLIYFLCGLLIWFSSTLLNFNASGHICALIGPILVLTSFVNYYYSFLLLLLIPVVWSSLKLKRHTVMQLVAGALIAVLCFLLSVTLIV